MSWGPATGCALLGFGFVFLLVPGIIFAARRLQLGRGREFHHTNKGPVPRLGGLALAVAFLAVELFLVLFLGDQRSAAQGRIVVLLSSLAMFALGFCDDLIGLGAKRKLVGQILIATCVYVSGIGIETVTVPFTGQTVTLHAWGGLLTVLWLVGTTNLMNLIDGVDGLAGGLAIMLMGLLVYVGLQNGTYGLLAAGMTGALAGFLCYNFPPARIYLGDGGAYLLGFQIGIFSLAGSHKGTVMAALVAPLFVLALPIVDTSLAILRRGLRGLPVFRADRSHIHHRLLRTGMSRRQVVLCLYGVTLVFLVLGFAASWSRGHLLPALTGSGVLVLLLCAGKLNFAREWFAVGRTVGNSLAMREQIHYALSLTKWLKLEAKRCQSLGELYQDIVFVARRLGFTGVKMSCHGGEWNWRQEHQAAPGRRFRLELHGFNEGVLELEAPVCSARPEDCSAGADGNCACRSDAKVFEVMADLLAEAWQPALLQAEAITRTNHHQSSHERIPKSRIYETPNTNHTHTRAGRSIECAG